jgi:hypothetical protein
VEGDILCLITASIDHDMQTSFFFSPLVYAAEGRQSFTSWNYGTVGTISYMEQQN